MESSRVEACKTTYAGFQGGFWLASFNALDLSVRFIFDRSISAMYDPEGLSFLKLWKKIHILITSET